MSVIHNFYAWIKTELPTINFVKHNFRKATIDDCTLIKQYGGEGAEFYDRKDYSIQILTRNKSDHEANTISNTIYEKLKYQFQITLPEVTIKSVVYPAIIVAKITSRQLPGGIGSDKEMRYMYSFNITIVTT